MENLKNSICLFDVDGTLTESRKLVQKTVIESLRELSFTVMPDCSISKSLGLDHNFGKVMGHRSKRFAMIVKDRIITKLFVEEIGAFEVSTAENLLDNL